MSSEEIKETKEFETKEELLDYLNQQWESLSKEEFVELVNDLTEKEVKGGFRDEILNTLDSIYLRVMGYETQITEDEYEKKIPAAAFNNKKIPQTLKRKAEKSTIIQLPKRSK